MTLEQAGITVTKSMTQPSRLGKEPRPVWEVSGNVFGYEAELYDLGAKKWRGKFSFWEDPTEALEAILENGAKSFAERQDATQQRAADRAERLAERAEKHQAAGDAAFAQVERIHNMIPMGQPILVGHHSEGRHRKDLDRIDRNMRKSIDEHEYAEQLQQRAELNQQKAAGEHLTPRYIQNRIDEADTNVRRIRASGADEQALSEWEERAAYWRGKLAEIGGIQYSKENVKKGDRVCWRGRAWAVVIRANAKTCTVEFEGDNMRGLGGPVKWADITDHAQT